MLHGFFGMHISHDGGRAIALGQGGPLVHCDKRSVPALDRHGVTDPGSLLGQWPHRATGRSVLDWGSWELGREAVHGGWNHSLAVSGATQCCLKVSNLQYCCTGWRHLHAIVQSVFCVLSVALGVHQWGARITLALERQRTTA